MLAMGLEDLAFSDVFDESRVEPGRKLLKIYRTVQVPDKGNEDEETKSLLI